MSGENTSQPNISDSTNTSFGSSNFNDMIQSPDFKRYLMAMGSGMMNKPSFGQAINAGLASGGMEAGKMMEKQEEQKLKLEEEAKRAKMIKELLAQFSNGEDLASLIGNVDFTDLQRNIGRK